jgi:hypothetical protein
MKTEQKNPGLDKEENQSTIEQKYNELAKGFEPLNGYNCYIDEKPQYVIKTYTTYGIYDDVIR